MKNQQQIHSQESTFNHQFNNLKSQLSSFKEKQQQKSDYFQNLSILLDKNVIHHKTINIYDQGRLAIKKVILIDRHKNINYQNKQSINFINAFHGTNRNAMLSIAVNGLKAAGQKVKQKTLITVQGHVPLNQEQYNIKNWAGAIFSTPSIFYASHQIYSIQFQQDIIKWLPVVQLMIKQRTYTQHDHPFQKRMIEFKYSEMKNLIIRNQKSEDVIVVGLIYINKNFLQESNLSYEQLTKMVMHREQNEK